MNVLDFALKMEADGKTFYEKLAKESDAKELKNLFNLLAAAEQTHYDALLARKNEVAFAKVESGILEQAKNIFQRLTEMKSEVEFRVDTDGYRHAIKAEEQSIDFYEESAAKEQDLEVRRLLQALADEEKIHLNIVENIYDFVESPKFFLAWREFSNLKEL
jgi:rubrerythrin